MEGGYEIVTSCCNVCNSVESVGQIESYWGGRPDESSFNLFYITIYVQYIRVICVVIHPFENGPNVGWKVLLEVLIHMLIVLINNLFSNFTHWSPSTRDHPDL